MGGDGAPSFAQLFVSTLVVFGPSIIMVHGCLGCCLGSCLGGWALLVPGRCCCESFHSPNQVCVSVTYVGCCGCGCGTPHVLCGHSSRCDGRCNTFLLSCCSLVESLCSRFFSFMQVYRKRFCLVPMRGLLVLPSDEYIGRSCVVNSKCQIFTQKYRMTNLYDFPPAGGRVFCGHLKRPGLDVTFTSYFRDPCHHVVPQSTIHKIGLGFSVPFKMGTARKSPRSPNRRTNLTTIEPQNELDASGTGIPPTHYPHSSIQVFVHVNNSLIR